MTDPEKEQLWNCISKMKSMPWKKPRGGEHNWDYPSMRKLFEKLVVYSDNQQPTAAWRLLNSDPYKYMIYPWYKSQLYNCIAFILPLRTVWDNISNVPVGDPNSVYDWQTFYDFEILFDKVVVTGNTVDIYPINSFAYGTATLSNKKFAKNPNLLEFIDFGGWFYDIGNNSFFGTEFLQKIYLPGPINYFQDSCFLNAGDPIVYFPAIGTYPACPAIDQYAFQNTKLFIELYLPIATNIGVNSFNNITIDVLDISAFLYTGSLITNYYTLEANVPSAICMLDVSWQIYSLLTAVSMESDYNTGIKTKYIIKNAISPVTTQYAVSNSVLDQFPSGGTNLMWFIMAGPDLTPYGITYYYEITGPYLNIAENFELPSSISNVFVSSASGFPFEIKPKGTGIGKQFLFSVYEGTDNTGILRGGQSFIIT